MDKKLDIKGKILWSGCIKPPTTKDLPPPKKLSKKKNKVIKPYFLCPAIWATAKGNICRLDAKQCKEDVKNLQKCPKLQKYILKGFI